MQTGKNHSLETKEKMRLAHIGRKLSKQTRDKIRRKALGRQHTVETKEKIRQMNIGKKISSEVKANLLYWATGPRSFNWKGKKVGYRCLHSWVVRKLGKPTDCAHCPKKGLTGHSIHWANKSGRYKRDITDWIRLCALCHKRYDAKKKLKKSLLALY